jgi:hypothetical protein
MTPRATRRPEPDENGFMVDEKVSGIGAHHIKNRSGRLEADQTGVEKPCFQSPSGRGP